MKRIMQAWRFNQVNSPLELIKHQVPTPKADEVVIDVYGSGLCHSDVGRMDGTLTPYMPQKPPIILGHEIAGVISAIGPNVKKFELGDRVVASGTQRCCPGRDFDGGYATHCVLPVSCLLPLPDNVSFVQGAAATDAGQTSHHAVVAVGQVRAGDKVGIIGLGGLGMAGARIAALKGATVYAAEPRKETWSIAKYQGVQTVVKHTEELANFELDLIVDFAGFGGTTADAIQAIKPNGTVVLVGLGKTASLIPTMSLVAKQVTLRGSGGGQPSDTAAILDYMATGDLEIQASTIGFGDIPMGLERLKNGAVVGRLVAEIEHI